jgi:uncharacterized membrane protein YgdD (TMEM256/DUF423 family)
MKIEGRELLIMGSLFAGLGVALGAVGSHALKQVLLQNNRTETFEIAVRYQLYHGLALLVIGILSYVLKETNFTLIGMLLFSGVILFSGSLYALSLTSIRWVVYITPIGGMLMIGGWVLLFIRMLQIQK